MNQSEKYAFEYYFDIDLETTEFSLKDLSNCECISFQYLEADCTFFGETSYLSEQVAGWVCERPPARFRGC